MRRINYLFLLIPIVLFLFISISEYTYSATEAEVASYFSKVCSDNGGINCSVITADSSVVCNDGTGNKLFSIYAIPQCQKIIENIAKEQSEFMVKSLCFPPSEMFCTNEKSYDNLSKILKSSGLVNSELGKGDLNRCRGEINSYKFKESSYRQCLLQNGRPNFVPVGKVALPILKAVFCPIFYGEKSSYNPTADLCVCENGYFVYGEKCTSAPLICQVKYGPNSSVQNGNCSCKQGWEFNQDKTRCVIQNETVSKATPRGGPLTIQAEETPRVGSFSPEVITLGSMDRPEKSSYPKIKISDTDSSSGGGFFSRIFSFIMSGFGSVLK